MLKDEVDFASKLLLTTVDKYRTIVTDRLHVSIAAALMNKEVYMLDNSYGKLSAVYQHSLKNCPRVHLCTEFPSNLKNGSFPTDNFDNIIATVKKSTLCF